MHYYRQALLLVTLGFKPVHGEFVIYAWNHLFSHIGQVGNLALIPTLEPPNNPSHSTNLAPIQPPQRLPSQRPRRVRRV